LLIAEGIYFRIDICSLHKDDYCFKDNHPMSPRKLSIITGTSYLIIFLTAIFANFLVLQSLQQHPLETVTQHGMLVRFGIIAFMVTVVFDVVVAWGLFELFPKHQLTRLSTYFRLMHAAIFGVGIYALTLTLGSTSAPEILGYVDTFNKIWLIGLFFFGIHLILLARILQKPKWITMLLAIAGVMYMVDTGAHFLLPEYISYANIFLALVAIPSILGEMSFSIWLLAKGGKQQV
jgi:hypothetical protein